MKITNHGYDRLDERVGLNPKAAEKLALKAFEHGIKHSDTTGSLNKYLTNIYLSHKTANNCRIYGEHVYLFQNTLLITAYHLKNEYKKTVRKIFNQLRTPKECT